MKDLNCLNINIEIAPQQRQQKSESGSRLRCFRKIQIPFGLFLSAISRMVFISLSHIFVPFIYDYSVNWLWSYFDLFFYNAKNGSAFSCLLTLFRFWIFRIMNFIIMLWSWNSSSCCCCLSLSFAPSRFSLDLQLVSAEMFAFFIVSLSSVIVQFNWFILIVDPTYFFFFFWFLSISV